MLLKKIRMIGFKSFADETIVEPETGLTAVVGPNGCGKSNIVDAVRWVLGEKSGRALRGKSMEDVIFMGSENRKPAGMAEVELFFDNQHRELPVDTDEVVIGRRIYLNSSSEYIMNGKKTTRREMERVFMDTGIGKTAYSIMEQGRMSEILKASPEERRNLFDEAAGVSRFKSQRAETLQRLGDTEQNLQRLGDILKSKKDEVENLERQARKTRQYLKLKEHLDRFDRHLRYLNYLDLEAKKEKAKVKLQTLFQKRDELQEKIQDHESRLGGLESDNEGQVEAMHRMDREFHQDLSRMESIRQNVQRIQTERKEKQEKLSSLESHKKQEEKLYGEIQARIQQSLQLELDMDSEMKSLESSSQKLKEKIAELQRKIESSVEQEEKNIETLKEVEQGQANLLEELKDVTHELILELESRKRELADRDARRLELSDFIEGKLINAKSAMEDVSKEISSAKADQYLKILNDLSPASLLESFTEYRSIENEFRSFLFGKSGLLARKEGLDTKMGELQEKKEALQKENNHLFEQRKLDSSQLEKEKNRKVETDLQIRDFQARKESTAEARETIVAREKETGERLAYYQKELEDARQQFHKSEKEETELKAQLADIEKHSKMQTASIEDLKKGIEKNRKEISRVRESLKKDRENLEKMLPEIGEQERVSESIEMSISSLQEDLYNDFQLSTGELISECEKKNLRKEQEESEYRRIKGEIMSLGQFNALAIEEEERAKEAYEELLKQKKDIEEARKHIQDLLDDIDEKTKVRFLETFEQIQRNFQTVFHNLFNGGSSSLSLTDEKDPMNGGIEIMVQPPGKKNSSITLLSGGEQNMTAIALMFATYLVRPSPFCLLDEIDAPLDDTNVGRFLNMLETFTDRSQFLMITHNKLSMSASEALFGVTQEEPGVSKIVSVEVKDAQNMVSAG